MNFSVFDFQTALEKATQNHKAKQITDLKRLTGGRNLVSYNKRTYVKYYLCSHIYFISLKHLKMIIQYIHKDYTNTRSFQYEKRETVSASAQQQHCFGSLIGICLVSSGSEQGMRRDS